MNKKLLSGFVAIGLLAGGGSATALVAAGAPAAAASPTATASSTAKAHDCGPLEPLIAKGTITRAQAMAIHNGFSRYFHDHWRNILDTVVAQQVKNHTITKAQATAITNAIAQWIHKYQHEGSAHHGACG
ncbi:MAG TPA: hypothetical protein VN695_12095 [Streptosporangiaceae bacterium]|nr:hypothetical protein [Streptosporangiaceae bacterium]